MSSKIAAQIVALRNCFEDLIVRVCMNLEVLQVPSEADKEFVAILKELSSDTAWIPNGEERNFVKPQNSFYTQETKSLATGVPSPNIPYGYESLNRGSYLGILFIFVF